MPGIQSLANFSSGFGGIGGNVLRSTGVDEWELERLGWSDTGMFLFLGIPALLLLITRRDWAEYGVSLKDWPFHLDLGIKAYLVRIIPVAFFLGVTVWLGMGYRTLAAGAVIAVGEIIGIAIMLVVLNRSRPTKRCCRWARLSILSCTPMKATHF